MHGFADRPPGTLWVPAFVVEAEGFSPAARVVRQPAAGLKPSARFTKPCQLTARLKDAVGESPTSGSACADAGWIRLLLCYDRSRAPILVAQFRKLRETPMTMHPQTGYLIPAETERVARAAFPTGSPIMRIRDELGMLFADTDFTALFPHVGQLAISPSRLILVTIFQFIVALGDRQASDAVR